MYIPAKTDQLTGRGTTIVPLHLGFGPDGLLTIDDGLEEYAFAVEEVQGHPHISLPDMRADRQETLSTPGGRGPWGRREYLVLRLSARTRQRHEGAIFKEVNESSVRAHAAASFAPGAEPPTLHACAGA